MAIEYIKLNRKIVCDKFRNIYKKNNTEYVKYKHKNGKMTYMKLNEYVKIKCSYKKECKKNCKENMKKCNNTTGRCNKIKENTTSNDYMIHNIKILKPCKQDCTSSNKICKIKTKRCVNEKNDI
tara:strand:+ start:8131 stop:8502 length:372 start_codon:yes stop_codon:yes gene_type:complete